MTGAVSARAINDDASPLHHVDDAVMFRYVALQYDGTRVTGTLPAPSHEQALAELHRRGWYPVHVARASRITTARIRIPASECAVGFRMLANLLDAGLPLNKTLAAFAEMAPPSWEPGLPELHRAIRDGKTFATALSQSPLRIPPVVIGIVRAGELGSGLALAVRRSAELLEQNAATRSAIRSALAYPAVLATAGIASLILLLGIVLPRFAVMISGLGQSIPRTTQLVLDAAHVVRTLAIPGTVTLFVILLLWIVWTRTSHGRLRWRRMLLVLPYIGPLRTASTTARVSAALASLLESGVPLASALSHAARAADDPAVEHTLLEARERVVHGSTPSEAFTTTKALSPTAIRLVRAGETSGRLAQMFAHAATIEQEFATQRITRFVRLLEPAIILGFGGLVALVAAALLQAMYAVRPAG